MTSYNNDILQDMHSYGAALNSREIFLHNFFSGTEDENPGVDYRMANIFLKNLRMLENKSSDPIRIHMNSIGGSWTDGMVIYDAICMSKCYISIIAYGQAESMSSIILQSGDERLITPNTYFMAHYGSSEATGDYLSSQNWMQYEKHICDTMLDIYSSSCIKGKFFKEKYAKPDIKKIKNFLSKKLQDGDWYMTAEETVYYGFADKIIKSI
jgi:ATP-dependent protease ClpP protease subunit